MMQDDQNWTDSQKIQRDLLQILYIQRENNLNKNRLSRLDSVDGREDRPKEMKIKNTKER